MPAPHRAIVVAFALAFAGMLPACNFTQEGEPPPPNTLNYPIALALSPAHTVDFEGTPAPRYLYVVNSNFDLRYNTGSLQAIDLEVLEDAMGAGYCGAPNENCRIKLNTPNSPPDLIAAEMGVGSHADGVFIAPDESRVYLSLRSAGTLGVVDVVVSPEGVDFQCEEELDDDDVIPRCGDGYLAGRHRVASERELVLAGDPVAVTGGLLSDISDVEGTARFVVLAMRDGRVALFIDDDRDPADDVFATPRLVHIASGFPESLITATREPGTGVVWLTSAATATMGRAAIAVDPTDAYRSFVYDFGGARLQGVDDANDIRDVKFDVADPTRAFALSRRPESVMTLDVARGGGVLPVESIAGIGEGPSRLAVIELAGTTYVLASCFDEKKLFVVQPDLGLVSIVGGLSGPFEIAYDAARMRLYLADFSTSQLRVLDMAPLAARATPTLMATIGLPVTAGSLTD